MNDVGDHRSHLSNQLSYLLERETHDGRWPLFYRPDHLSRRPTVSSLPGPDETDAPRLHQPAPVHPSRPDLRRRVRHHLRVPYQHEKRLPPPRPRHQGWHRRCRGPEALGRVVLPRLVWSAGRSPTTCAPVSSKTPWKTRPGRGARWPGPYSTPTTDGNTPPQPSRPPVGGWESASRWAGSARMRIMRWPSRSTPPSSEKLSKVLVGGTLPRCAVARSSGGSPATTLAGATQPWTTARPLPSRPRRRLLP